METAKKSFGTNLRHVIDKMDITYSNAADRIGVSLSFLNQLMRGESGPSIEMIFQIAEKLSCRASELFGEFENEKADLLTRLYTILPTLNEDQLRQHLILAEGNAEDNAATGALVSNESRNKAE